MKFKGSFLTAASGSLGGITASKNRGGQYLRGRLIPTDPAATLQTTVRAIFGAVTARWLADLTAAQRTAWNLYADNSPVTDALGDPILLSGHQMFVRTNVSALSAGETQIDDGPTTFGTGELPVIDTPGVLVSTISVTLTAVPAATTAILFAGRPQNPSTAFFKGPWRFVGTSTSSPVSGGNPFSAAVGQNQWVKIRYLNDDGRLSGEVIAGPVTVGADP